MKIQDSICLWFEIKKDLLNDEKYAFLFSVEEVNKLVLQGMPFRDAYKKIGQDIRNRFAIPIKAL